MNLTVECLNANPDFLASFVNWGVSCSGLQKEITAGRIVYDDSKAAACETALGSMTCTQYDSGDLPAACAEIIRGTVSNGSNCYQDGDCSNGFCTDSASVCPGKCQAYAQASEDCSTATCAAGLVCDTTMRICTPTSGVGLQCPCNDGLWCDGTDQTCKAKLTGGACTSQDQCAFGYVCADVTKTCLAYVGKNGDCSASPDVCGLGYACDAGTCVSWPKLGEACGTTDANAVCIGGYCDVLGTQKCVAYKKIGDACTYPMDLMACEPGSTCDAATSKCKASTALVCTAP